MAETKMAAVVPLLPFAQKGSQSILIRTGPNLTLVPSVLQRASRSGSLLSGESTHRFWRVQTSRCSCLDSSSPPAAGTDFLPAGQRTRSRPPLQTLSAGPPARLQPADAANRVTSCPVQLNCSQSDPPGGAPSVPLHRLGPDRLLPQRHCTTTGRRCRCGRQRASTRRRERRSWPR